MVAARPKLKIGRKSASSDRFPNTRTMSQAKELNLLEGSLWDKMIIIALPLAFTGVLQQLFNAADVAVLGHYVSSDAMAAVGNNVPVIGLIVSLCMGLALGVNVVTARYLGMRQKELASESVHTALALSVAFGVAIALLGEIFCGFIMDVLDVPESVLGTRRLPARLPCGHPFYCGL